jgi:hypothetical protein
MQYVAISLCDSRNKACFYVFLLPSPPTMRQPGTPRQPLGEVSPNTRSRVVSARDHGIKFTAIGRMENLLDSTCRGIYKNASHQTSCITPSRPGRPPLLTIGDQRLIRRAIVAKPKITAAQLVVNCCPHVKKKTVYRYLKKSGIQKWRCRQRPFLTEEHAAKRLAWAEKYDGKPVSFWRKLRWSDECSIERGKGGAIEWVYRLRGKFPPFPSPIVPL